MKAFLKNVLHGNCKEDNSERVKADINDFQNQAYLQTTRQK